jgi:hypothetical protein
MALFPELIIRSKKGIVEKLWPLQVDERSSSLTKSGQMSPAPRQGVDYSKIYAYIDISNVVQVPKRQTKALFDLFFDAQDHENILDIEFKQFRDKDRKGNHIWRRKFKGWITQYAIIDPVTDLRGYVDPNWDPSDEHDKWNFLPIGGDSYMALLRLELTAATDEQNKKGNKVQ